MGFVKVEGTDKFFAEVKKPLEEAPEKLLSRLCYIGEAAVKHARLHGTYEDQTGNLRSSIGYVVLQDGIPYRYATPKIFEEGDEGAAKMRKLLEKLRREYPTGIVLIVCAGMEYASYVEDIHGRDVTTGARLLVEDLVRRLIEKKK